MIVTDGQQPQKEQQQKRKVKLQHTKYNIDIINLWRRKSSTTTRKRHVIVDVVGEMRGM